MIKSLLIFLLIFTMYSCAQNPKLKSEKIVMDKETLEIINNYQNPSDSDIVDGEKFELIVTDDLETINPNKSVGDSIELFLSEKFQPRYEIFLKKDVGGFAVVDSNNKVIEIRVASIPDIEVEVRTYGINKKINSINELILITEIYQNADLQNMMQGKMEPEGGELKYSTSSNSFIFSNIKEDKFQTAEEVIHQYID